jgi:pseudaminic acid cytidylyltransferase
MKRLLIIPTRSGSKRIKNKNIKKFFNKPMIYYSIETALKANLFDEIHVSTDSRKTLKIISKFNLKNKFLRPKYLAGDQTGIFDVLEYVVKKYYLLGEKFDEVWSMSACSPLIIAGDLKKASKLLNKNPNKIILPVSKYSTPIEWAFEFKKNSKILKPFKKNCFKIRSQDLTTKYFDTGQFICFKNSKFISLKKNIDNNYLGLKIPNERSVDIDDNSDWRFAEKLFKVLEKKIK